MKFQTVFRFQITLQLVRDGKVIVILVFLKRNVRRINTQLTNVNAHKFKYETIPLEVLSK